ncbi:MAG TPA: NmrA/HSCARG family protein [Candidatus Thermoplasmatota archaeon]|nr:NmrA/HSCARG family protein [Candidatus Thermoplasmatota archaeon]
MLFPYPVPADTPLTVLVVGATGKQGGAVAKHLLARGHRVRALTRHPASEAGAALLQMGADLVQGDLEDPESLRRALRGVDSAFLMATPYEAGPEAEVRQAMNFLEAFEAEAIPHLVYSSVASADRRTGIPHFETKARIEERIRQRSLPHTVVAPVWFMDNFATPLYGPGIAQGRLAMPLPAGRPLQMIAVEDIGSFATIVVESRDTFLGKRLDIAGDVLSPRELVQVLSTLTGRAVDYEETSLEALRSENPDWAAMFEWFDRVGYSADIEGLRRDYPQVAWHRFADWARRVEWRALGQTRRPQAERQR